jgi:hypothetical protein
MKTKLHKIAIRNGWYRQITNGLPLNVCKTIFGVYFFEGVYTPYSVKSICEFIYDTGVNDGQTWAREAATNRHS